ncbi:MAG: hypothetical protein WAL16_09350, partial [Streptosporangiaceae bacterium]
GNVSPGQPPSRRRGRRGLREPGLICHAVMIATARGCGQPGFRAAARRAGFRQADAVPQLSARPPAAGDAPPAGAATAQ